MVDGAYAYNRTEHGICRGLSLLDSDTVEQVWRALLDRAASKPKQSGGAAERTTQMEPNREHTFVA